MASLKSRKTRQTCLCQYLRKVCNHPDTLLQLPKSIRERIYMHAGLVTDERLCVGEWVADFEGTAVLLSICRQTREEIEALVPRHNTVVIAHGDISRKLAILKAMSPKACAALQDLHVEVTSWDWGKHDSPQWELIRQWQAAAMHCLNYATPGQLKLRVVCDVGDDLDKARALLSPFDWYPGCLWEIELSLSPKRNLVVLGLTREMAHRALVPGQRTCSHPFPFFNLPLEIRRHIYSYTGLVLPYRNIMWTPDDGFQSQSFFCECDGSVCRDRDLHHNENFYTCMAGDFEGGYSFCHRRNGGYSSRCQHGGTLSLLLANRALYEEAIAFFYESNRITIAANRYPEHAISPWEPTTSYPPNDDANTQNSPTLGNSHIEETYSSRQIEHEPTYLFIKHVGHDKLRHIRTLEIVCPRITTRSSHLELTLPVYREWAKAVKKIAKYSSPASLTIMIHIFSTRPGLSWSHSKTQDTLRAQGLRLVAPLRLIPRLGRLFIFLEWPQNWSPTKLHRDIEVSGLPQKDSPGCGIGRQTIQQPDPVFMADETRLEKLVVGHDYDSFMVGKGEVLPSPWLRSGWTYPQD